MGRREGTKFNSKKMKKVMSVFGAILIASTLFTSFGCGNKKDSVMIRPETTTIKGDLGDYFEVVDREYEIEKQNDEMSSLITVEVQRNDKNFSFPVDNINVFGTNGGEDYHVGFGIELLGESGPVQIIQATEEGIEGAYSSEDVLNLMKLKTGESGYIRWSIDKAEGIKSFQLTSALQKVKHSTSSSSSSAVVADCEQFCTDYEAFADEYVAFMKKYKANPSNASLVMEYAEMVQKAAYMQESSKGCKADAKDAARITIANAKIATASM